MILTNRIKSFILVFLLVSISHIAADTNATNNTHEVATSSLSLELDALNTMRLQQLDALEIMLSMAGNLLSVSHKNVEEEIIVPLQIINELRSLDVGMMTTEILYELCLFNKECVTYLAQIISNQEESFPDFSPDLSNPDTLVQRTFTETEALLMSSNAALELLLPPLDELAQGARDIFAQMVTAQYKQLDTLENILQLITNKINSGTFKNKTELRQNIAHLRKEIQQLINELKKNDFNPLIIASTNAIISILIDHIQDAGKNDFVQLGQINEDELIKRVQDQQAIDLGQLKNQIQQTGLLLAKLEKKAEQADLSWSALVARSMDDYVISPLLKYHKEVIVGATAVGIAGYLWYHFGGKSEGLTQKIRTFKLPSFLQKWLHLPDAPIIGYPGRHTPSGDVALGTINPFNGELFVTSFPYSHNFEKLEDEKRQGILSLPQFRVGSHGQVGYLGMTEELVTGFVAGKMPLLAGLTGIFCLLWSRSLAIL